jgi:SAM-dependent methyltransferase
VRRNAIDKVGLLVAWLNRHRRLHPSDGVVKVNLGSALLVAPGWINVDASVNALLSRAPTFILHLAYRWSGSNQLFGRDEYSRILRSHHFVHCNFRYGLPFDNSTVDFVYSSHLLEHLHRDEALALLREVYRILKPGGCVRICVPDLSHAVSLLNEGKSEKALGYFFAGHAAGALNRHQYMYNSELLAAALGTSGLVNGAQRRFQEGDVPDLDILDNRPEETLYMEARKAGLPSVASADGLGP